MGARHFSRYFEADIGVPPAVWRSMDRAVHSDEVASRGLSISGHGHSSGMNHAGWRKLVDADKNPKTYSPTDELFTADRKALYGALLNSPGSRYGSEVNGTRASGWGKGQNLDFQETAPFRALRSGAPIERAISEGIAEAIKTSRISEGSSAWRGRVPQGRYKNSAEEAAAEAATVAVAPGFIAKPTATTTTTTTKPAQSTVTVKPITRFSRPPPRPAAAVVRRRLGRRRARRWC